MFTPTTTITTLSAARLDADLIWLCVPDAVLPEVSASIASRRSLHSQVVIHSSGVLGTSVLQPARDSGALIGSVHPLMTFPTRTPIPLIGVHFAIEAGAVLERRLTKLVQLLGGLPFSVTSRGKPLYHAAAVMASPLLVSLATATLSIAVASGLTEKQALVLLEPIMKASIHNFFKDGTASSFSGPFARGDAETVSLHLAALKEHPFQQQVYRALADYALQALPAKNRQELQRRLASNPGLYTEG